MGPVCGVRAVALAPNPSAYYLLPPRVLSTGSSCSRPAPEVCPSRPLSALERTARPPPPPAPIPPVLQPSPTVNFHFFASPSLVAGCANLRGRPHLSRDGAKPHRTFLPLPPSALEAHLRADAPTYLFFSLRRAGRGALATRRGHRGAAQGCARPATGTRRVAAAPAQTAPGPPVCMRAACVRDHLPRSRASTRPPCAACAPRGYTRPFHLLTPWCTQEVAAAAQTRSKDFGCAEGWQRAYIFVRPSNEGDSAALWSRLGADK